MKYAIDPNKHDVEQLRKILDNADDLMQQKGQWGGTEKKERAKVWFYEDELKENIGSSDCHPDDWYDEEEMYYDPEIHAFVERTYRGDKYTDEKHPKWEHKKTILQGRVERRDG